MSSPKQDTRVTAAKAAKVAVIDKGCLSKTDIKKLEKAGFAVVQKRNRNDSVNLANYY